MSKPQITIEYCVECMYLKPALAAAQAILETHAEQIESVTLKPGHDGVLRVYTDDSLIIQMGDEGLPNVTKVDQAVQEYLVRRTS